MTQFIEKNRSPLQRLRWWPVLRRPALIAVYAVAFVVCLWLGYGLRFDFRVSDQYRVQFSRHWYWIVGLQIAVLAGFRHFTGITKYFSLRDLQRVAAAAMVSATLLYLGRYVSDIAYSPPRGVILTNALLTVAAVAGMRIGYRYLHDRHWSLLSGAPDRIERVAIIGAGDVGASLVQELESRPSLGLEPVIFLDDDRRKWRHSVHGIPVAGRPEALRKLGRRYRLSKVIIAMPSAPAKRVGQVAAAAQRAHLSCVTVPGIDQLTTGRVALTQLRPISIEDLLGRDPVSLEVGAIHGTFAGQVVMVTGAGGSIGSELCRQIARFGPKRLLLVEHCEVQMFQIEQEMIRLLKNVNDQAPAAEAPVELVPLVANILDPVRMRSIFEAYRPSVVFHAAAHKHVPMMERQPTEAVRNNSLGTAALADLALEYGVQRFLMISTDKAVNPTSVMGASKRLAEVYLQALFARHPQRTKFVCVRFGNVLGSSGSVVPTFTRQIAAGGPVTVTDPEMMRYFMTIPEAVGLVLQSCAQGAGGEIFVLDMGQPVKIADLARQMIELSGLRPGVDIEIRYVGLRPGEKLFEELKLDGENFRPTRHPRIMSFLHPPEPLEEVRRHFARLAQDLYTLAPGEIRARIRELVPEYTPYADPGTAEPPDHKPAKPAPAARPVLVAPVGGSLAEA